MTRAFPEEETNANARLISKAPELLCVLEGIVALERSYDGACWAVEKRLGDLMTQADTIIAALTGGGR
jgi:hypothetical protein